MGDRTLVLISIGMALLFSLPSPAQEEEDAPKVETIPKLVAVQRRPYVLTDELTFQSGYLPMDSFTKYVAVGATYTHYFTDFIGWEVVNASYAINISTGLEEDLKNNYSTELQDQRNFDVLDYYIASNAIFTPLYTKNLLFDDNIVYGEVSFTAGPVVSRMRDAGFVGGINFGAYFRFLIGQQTSLKFDIREHVYFKGDTKQHLMLMVGFAYNFGTPSETTQAP